MLPASLRSQLPARRWLRHWGHLRTGRDPVPRPVYRDIYTARCSPTPRSVWREHLSVPYLFGASAMEGGGRAGDTPPRRPAGPRHGHRRGPGGRVHERPVPEADRDGRRAPQQGKAGRFMKVASWSTGSAPASWRSPPSAATACSTPPGGWPRRSAPAPPASVCSHAGRRRPRIPGTRGRAVAGRVGRSPPHASPRRPAPGRPPSRRWRKCGATRWPAHQDQQAAPGPTGRRTASTRTPTPWSGRSRGRFARDEREQAEAHRDIDRSSCRIARVLRDHVHHRLSGTARCRASSPDPTPKML